MGQPAERQDDDRLVSRKQISDDLIDGFKIEQSPETLRMLLHTFDIRPIRRGRNPVPPSKGSVGLYDPLVTWVMATYFAWPKLLHRPAEYPAPDAKTDRSRQREYLALKACRLEARARRDNRDDALTERLAYYLYISDPRWGMDLRLLDAAVDTRPELLERSLDDPEVLVGVLTLYKQALVESAIGRSIHDVERGEPWSITVPRERRIVHEETDPDTGHHEAYYEPLDREVDGVRFLGLMRRAQLID